MPRRLGLEADGENQRDGEALVAAAPSWQGLSGNGRRFGMGMRPKPVSGDADAYVVAAGAESAFEGSFGLADVCHVSATLAPELSRTDCIGLVIV